MSYTASRARFKMRDVELDPEEAMAGNDTVHEKGTGIAAKPTDGVFSLNVPFAKGYISVQVRVVGDAISPAHLARVRKHLELTESEWDDGE